MCSALKQNPSGTICYRFQLNKTTHTTCCSFLFLMLTTKICLSIVVRTHICCVLHGRGHWTDQMLTLKRSGPFKKKVACQGWKLYHHGFAKASKKNWRGERKIELASQPGKCAAHGWRSCRASCLKKGKEKIDSWRKIFALSSFLYKV